jgi:hypothetical protein
MPNQKKLGAICLVVLALQLSCTRIPQSPLKEGALRTIKLGQNDSIPSDWGKLTSAVIAPDFPSQVQLWFQDEKGEIHMAVYDSVQGKLGPIAKVLPRN